MTLKLSAKHPDPDVVFQQPLRPGCWYEGCQEPRTTGMYIAFPLTAFAQGLCDTHAAKLRDLLEQGGYTCHADNERTTAFSNTRFIDALRTHVVEGTARSTDILVPEPFPKDWHKYATAVSLLYGWPDEQCWCQVTEETRCEREPQVTLVIMTIPGSRQKTEAPFTLIPKTAAPIVVGICRGHAQTVYRLAVKDNHFFRYPQPAGGVVFIHPACTFPFGRNPDDDPSDEKDAAAVA